LTAPTWSTEDEGVGSASAARAVPPKPPPARMTAQISHGRRVRSSNVRANGAVRVFGDVRTLCMYERAAGPVQSWPGPVLRLAIDDVTAGKPG
jgi:hypothetical protein